ncbi:MAG: NAD+ synthase [Candidatus Bathyarchaeota archaeon]|nr:NAD+ synthase [Candidatus Bathyarchaeota archaeon]
MDFSKVENRIRRFIKECVENACAEGIVLGLSGGVDSATIAALSSRAIGGNRVLALMLPEAETRSQQDLDAAKTVADLFGLRSQICDMTPAVEGTYKSIPIFDSTDRLCKGNIKARTRMVFLYYYANKQNRIVCGSSDKSETMMGYFTKWGDAAADIAPIIDLYKSQVRMLAVHLGIPKELAYKPSTPALWPNQKAEEELEIKFETLDLILYGLERFMSPMEIAEQLSLDRAVVDQVKCRWLANEHKRCLPMAPKLGYRTVTNDFRLPRHTY